MTPKEKAKELVDKFVEVEYLKDYEGMNILLAKQCALIAVNELIKTEYQTVSKLLEVIEKNKICLVLSLNKDYWQEVKKEIEKL